MGGFAVYPVSLNHWTTGASVLMQVLVTSAQSKEQAIEVFGNAFYCGERQPHPCWPRMRQGVARETWQHRCTTGALDQWDTLAWVSEHLRCSCDLK